MSTTRRDVLRALGALGAGAALDGCRGLLDAGPRARIALQTYSIAPYLESVGRAKAFAELAALGFRGIECGCGGDDAKELRKILDDNGLVAVSTHAGGPKRNPDDVLKAKAEYNCIIGSPQLISPGGTTPPGLDVDSPVLTWADSFDDHIRYLVDFYAHAADILRPYGLRIGLHNHTWEFRLRDRNGVTFWDRFFSAAPREVLMQLDVGWATAAGVDPKAYFRRYPHRSPTLHAKENEEPPFVDWDGLIAETEADGVGWYVVECEFGRDNLAAVTSARKHLKGKGLKD